MPYALSRIVPHMRAEKGYITLALPRLEKSNGHDMTNDY